MTLDIPYCFWVSMVTLVVAVVISLTNFFIMLNKRYISMLHMVVHIVGSAVIVASSWGVIGFGIGWIIQSIK